MSNTKTASKRAFHNFFSEYSKSHAFDYFSQDDSIIVDESLVQQNQNACTDTVKLDMSESKCSTIDQRNADAEFKSISKNPLRSLNTGLTFNPNKREAGHNKEMDASQEGDPKMKSTKRTGILPYKKTDRD